MWTIVFTSVQISSRHQTLYRVLCLSQSLNGRAYFPPPSVIFSQDKAYSSPFAGIAQGFDFLKKEKGILYIMLTMALINFCSRLTYENILSPMILARSSGSVKSKLLMSLWVLR